MGVLCVQPMVLVTCRFGVEAYVQALPEVFDARRNAAWIGSGLWNIYLSNKQQVDGASYGAFDKTLTRQELLISEN